MTMRLLGITLALLVSTQFALADPIVPEDGPWKEFSFGANGTEATAGTFAIPSGGGNSVALGNPAWTFAGRYVLTIVDAFEPGDQFEVFNWGVSLGVTSAPGAGGIPAVDTSDPDQTLLDGRYGRASFLLGYGTQQISIYVISGQGRGGDAYFRLTPAPSPEPGTLALCLTMLGGYCYWRRRRRAA